MQIYGSNESNQNHFNEESHPKTVTINSTHGEELAVSPRTPNISRHSWTVQQQFENTAKYLQGQRPLKQINPIWEE